MRNVGALEVNFWPMERGPVALEVVRELEVVIGRCRALAPCISRTECCPAGWNSLSFHRIVQLYIFMS